MPGLKFVLSEAFTDATLPILRADPILSEGSVFLFDPTHSMGGFGEGVPADGAAIPNLAWKEFVALNGAGDADSAAGKVVRSATGAALQLERTERGGLHAILSQVDGVNAFTGAMISPAQQVQQYIHDNTDDEFYVSYWFRLTRRPLVTTSPVSLFHKIGSNTSSTWLTAPVGQPSPTTGDRLLGRTLDPPEDILNAPVGAPMFRSIGLVGYNGTKPALAGVGSALGAGVGHAAYGLHFVAGMADAWVSSINVNKLASLVIERGYVENLTASGRDYAEVQALDHSLWQAAHASGGRWHGDTWTDPDTFP